MRPELLGGPAQQSHGLSLDSRPTTWPASQQEPQPLLETSCRATQMSGRMFVCCVREWEREWE